MAELDRYVIVRFALKSALLTFFALIQWRSGFVRTLSLLFTLTAFVDMALALYHKEAPRGAGLGYWDEAAASLLAGLLLGAAWA